MSSSVSQSQPVLASNGQGNAETSAALKPSEVLERAAALIEPEGAWCQGELAQDAEGDWAHPSSPEAVCRCLVGGVVCASGIPPGHGPVAPLYEIAPLVWVRKALGRPDDDTDATWVFNDADRRRQKTVVATLRKAAELAKAEGQ